MELIKTIILFRMKKRTDLSVNDVSLTFFGGNSSSHNFKKCENIKIR